MDANPVLLVSPPVETNIIECLECAPLSWDLTFLPAVTCAFAVLSTKPTTRAWGWQRTVVARGSDRILP
jgi:hypothetical protein